MKTKPTGVRLSPGIEFKEFNVKQTPNGSEGIVEGYAAVFNNVDRVGDVIVPGAFKRTIEDQKGKFPILSHHNQQKQIGWNIEAREDENGLFVVGKFDIRHNTMAMEHFSLIQMAKEHGAKAGLSIGFTIEDADLDVVGDKEVLKLREVRLFEYSPVTFPANPMATATDAKSMFGETLDQVIDGWRSNGATRDQVSEALLIRAARFKKVEQSPDHESQLWDTAKQDWKNILLGD